MRELRIAVTAAVVLTLVFGLAYPLVMTGAAQVPVGRARPMATRR